MPPEVYQVIFPPHVLETIILLAGAIMVLLLIAVSEMPKQ